VKRDRWRSNGRDLFISKLVRPDFDTPAQLIEAGADALHRDSLTTDLPRFARIARDDRAGSLSETRGEKVCRRSLVVFPGGKPIIFFIIPLLANKR